MQVFVDRVDLKRGIGFLNRGKLLKEHIENNILIDPIGATEKECRYCPYVKYCSKDGYKDTAPPKSKFKKKVVDEVLVKKKPKKKRNIKLKYKDPSDNFIL